MSRTTLASNLSKIYNDAVSSYGVNAQVDRRAMLEGLPVGATVPAARGITDNYLRERALGALDKKRQEAHAAIDRERQAVERELTNAPTTEEANYILSISSRNDMTDAEIQAGLKRYSSHAAQHAIAAAAQRSGKTAYVMQTDTEVYLNDLNELEGIINRAFTPYAMEQSEGVHAATVASIEAIAMGENQLAALVKG